MYDIIIAIQFAEISVLMYKNCLKSYELTNPILQQALSIQSLISNINITKCQLSVLIIDGSYL